MAWSSLFLVLKVDIKFNDGVRLHVLGSSDRKAVRKRVTKIRSFLSLCGVGEGEHSITSSDDLDSSIELAGHTYCTASSINGAGTRI